MVQSWTSLAIDRSAPTPLYVQLCDQIEGWIDDGVLEPGAKLPASRDLAKRIGLNRNTVTSAFEMLASRGRVSSHVGQGTFVTTAATPKPAYRWSVSRAVDSARERVRLPENEGRHPDRIDFATLVPDEELFPVEPFRLVVNDVLKSEGKKLLQYGPAAGHPPLRHYIAERLVERGVAVRPGNVLIVNGTQQALDLIGRTLLDPTDRVLVESPTYTILLPLLAQYQAHIDEVPMTPQGMDLDLLESALDRSRPKFIFTMPTFHNPTGATMDLQSRNRLVEIADEYEVPIVEDEFDAELRFEGEPLPPLAALDNRSAVLHIGTFSKGLFPGVRLGWIVAPDNIVRALERSKLISDYHTSLLPQAAVLEFCQRGHYQEHLKRLAIIYRDKSRALLGAIERHFPPGVSCSHPEGGFAFWVTLPPGPSADSILAECARVGVSFTPGSHFFARGDGRRFFRLSISRVPLDRVEEGIRRLGEVLAQRLGQNGSYQDPDTRSRDPEPALHI